MKQRDSSLDIIRIFACFLVVLMHSPLPSTNALGPFLTALSYFSAPCIGLFFMVSGALLLPVETDYFSFLRRRIGKVVFPTIIWSLIYIALSNNSNESKINLLQTIASIPFSAQGTGVLWFMYTLCGLYLIAPILSRWLEQSSKQEVKFILFLWSITLCYPLLRLWLSINESETGIFYYFSGYVGYFILGYYLKHYGNNRSLFIFICGFIALMGACLLYCSKIYKLELDFYTTFWYLSIFIVALCLFYWLMLHKIFNKFKCIDMSFLSNLSFGIYLIHILIMRYWVWKQNWIVEISNYIIQTFCIAGISFLISTALCYLFAKLPIGLYLIGFKFKHK